MKEMKKPVKFLSWVKIAFICFLESSVTFFVKTNEAKRGGEEGEGGGGGEKK